MTCFPTPVNTGHWWLVPLPAGALLHALARTDVTAADVAGWVINLGDAHPVAATAACGLRDSYDLPSMFDEASLPRCRRCCAALGIAAGAGAPDSNHAPPAHHRQPHRRAAHAS